MRQQENLADGKKKLKFSCTSGHVTYTLHVLYALVIVFTSALYICVCVCVCVRVHVQAYEHVYKNVFLAIFFPTKTVHVLIVCMYITGHFYPLTFTVLLLL